MGTGCGITFAFEFPKHLSPVPSGCCSAGPVGLRVSPPGLQHPSPAATHPRTLLLPEQHTESSRSFPAGSPRNAPCHLEMLVLAGTRAGWGSWSSWSLPRGVQELPGLGGRDTGTVRFGRLTARGCPFAGMAAARHQPGRGTGKLSLLEEQRDRVTPPGATGAEQSHGWWAQPGQMARYRRSGCQRHSASPDSFNINVYLQDRSRSPAPYSAARLQLSGTTVTAPADGRLVWA